MKMLKVDPQGFDELDRRMLRIIVESFDGGPVGVESLAAMALVFPTVILTMTMSGGAMGGGRDLRGGRADVANSGPAHRKTSCYVERWE